MMTLEVLCMLSLLTLSNRRLVVQCVKMLVRFGLILTFISVSCFPLRYVLVNVNRLLLSPILANLHGPLGRSSDRSTVALRQLVLVRNVFLKTSTMKCGLIMPSMRATRRSW